MKVLGMVGGLPLAPRGSYACRAWPSTRAPSPNSKRPASRNIDARRAGCGRIVQMPFRMLLERKQITTATTIAELRRRYRCQSCGCSRAESFTPWRAAIYGWFSEGFETADLREAKALLDALA
jgi:hypothetical protein